MTETLKSEIRRIETALAVAAGELKFALHVAGGLLNEAKAVSESSDGSVTLSPEQFALLKQQISDAVKANGKLAN